ncbi:BTB/POZ domain-containing protein [Vigna angularis]|uniref:BTB/POZ domain-containing protein n=1 Tax=Phaseolus angularis TaxID=3914 RepID=A0A8T0LD53_PHAAN|nr:BTB/POZ domain-containing protein [Vigna angularis]
MMSDDHKFFEDKRRKAQDRLSKLLWELALLKGDDIRLMVGRDDLRVSVEIRKSALAEKSRFFMEKLRYEGSQGQASVTEVLQRVSSDPSTTARTSS